MLEFCSLSKADTLQLSTVCYQQHQSKNICIVSLVQDIQNISYKMDKIGSKFTELIYLAYLTAGPNYVIEDT